VAGYRPQVTSPTPPARTVTFLFTDIEGSTALLRAAGDAYATLLAEHRNLLRTAVTAHGGREVSAEGDAFFAVFPSPVGAVAAAAEAQRSLTAHSWPAGQRVAVRMGLHTGEADVVGGQYVGLAVHKGARVASVAHGGQILLSEATAAVVGDTLPTGDALRGLGEHRLKDFPRPTRLYQLEGSGLPTGFPPLRTRVSFGPMPAPSGSFVGRARELDDVGQLLRDQRARLVTLTGPGGIGKTRLALEAARTVVDAFPGGVVFVALAAVTDPGLVLGSVAEAVGARREPGVAVGDAVAAAIGDDRTLLVLDNFEQVAEAAPSVAELLGLAPAAVVLATSRQALRLRVEQQYPVAPLGEDDAVRLFTDRASAVRPGFAPKGSDVEVVAEIGRRLDGLPLAIELAAARARLLAPDALLARLSERFDVLGSGPVDLPERQRTLRATMDWSYRQLGPHEQALFARLAVFAGGCGLDAVEEVCGRPGEPAVLDTVSELLANSLVVVSEGPGAVPRLDMLETVRAYASERLAELPDRGETEQRHTMWMLELFAARLAAKGSVHQDWLQRFDQERANLRAVARRAVDAGDIEMVARLARDGFVPLAHRDGEAEAVEWLDAALAVGAGPARPAVRGRLLVVRALASTVFGDFAAAGSLVDEGRALLPDDGDHAYDHALAAATDAYIAMAENPLAAAPLIADAAARLAGAGDELSQSYMEVTAGNRALHLDDLPAAERHYTTAVRLAERLRDDAMRGRALSLLGLTRLARGDAEAARRAVVDGAAANRRGGQPTGMAYSLDGLAAVALADGRPRVAARALAVSDAVRRKSGMPPSPAFLPLLAGLVAEARTRLGEEAYEAACSEAQGWHVIEALDRILADLAEPLR
jgi:predicted ATPase/class 3 adenylate cyclase